MKKVLLAIDGSQLSEEAAWLLSHLPQHQKLHLVVVTVLQIPHVIRRAGDSSQIATSLDREQQSAITAFQLIEKMFDGSNASLRHVIREGHRGRVIVDVATQEQVELVVIGARGQSTVRRLLLGSTSDYVATHAPCSVLVVRPTGLRDSNRPIQITISYQDTQAAKAALKEFEETVWGNQTGVRIVSVVSFISAFQNEIVIDTDQIEEAAKQGLQWAAESLAKTGLDVRTELIKADHVGDSLINDTESNPCDMVVVGEKPQNAMGRIIMGSVSRYVLRHAPCSVWITRRQRRRDQGPNRQR